MGVVCELGNTLIWLEIHRVWFDEQYRYKGVIRCLVPSPPCIHPTDEYYYHAIRTPRQTTRKMTTKSLPPCPFLTLFLSQWPMVRVFTLHTALGVLTYSMHGDPESHSFLQVGSWSGSLGCNPTCPAPLPMLLGWSLRVYAGQAPGIV